MGMIGQLPGGHSLPVFAANVSVLGTMFNRRYLGYLHRHWIEFPSRFVMERWVLPRLGMEPMTIRNLCQKGWPTVAALTSWRNGEDIDCLEWDTRHNSDGSELFEQHARESSPLLLKNYVSPPAEGADWSFDFVKEVAGDSKVTIRVGDYESDLGDARMVPMKLGKFIDTVVGRTDFPQAPRLPGGLKPYLGDSALPLLDRHLKVPRFIGRVKGATRYWMGSGARTAMHCHQSYDFFVQQLVGRRRFILLSPHQALLAGFWPRNYNIAITAYDPFAAEDAADEKTRQVHPIYVDLEPGDALLLPGFWFHAVEVSEPSLSAVMASETMPAAVGGGSRQPWRERPGARGW
jgi:hypothetical protein